MKVFRAVPAGMQATAGSTAASVTVDWRLNLIQEYHGGHHQQETHFQAICQRSPWKILTTVNRRLAEL